MDLPTPPNLEAVKSLSPSFYNTALLCVARAAWQSFGKKDSIPHPTSGILGVCFHEVMDAANSGQLASGQGAVIQANDVFDKKAKELLSAAHPLVRAKFAAPEKIPFYFQSRGRAAQIAVAAARTLPVAAEKGGTSQIHQPKALNERTRLVEEILSSKDGEIRGRIDLWERIPETVVDYKSGREPTAGEEHLSPNEIRQLKLYVYLLLQNDLPAKKAAIVRGSGKRVEVDVNPLDAENEAKSAKKLRYEFNEAVSKGATFFSVANPSPFNCAGCPCIPFCNPFWSSANKDWEALCGTHLQGRIVSHHDANYSGTILRTLRLTDCSGTAPISEATIEQVPLPWLTISGQSPSEGAMVRVIAAARQKENPQANVLHVDKLKSTSIWKV